MGARKRIKAITVAHKDFVSLKKAYHGLLKKLFHGNITIKNSLKSHFELLKEYENLRHHWLVQFLAWLHIVPREK